MGAFWVAAHWDTATSDQRAALLRHVGQAVGYVPRLLCKVTRSGRVVRLFVYDESGSLTDKLRIHDDGTFGVVVEAYEVDDLALPTEERLATMVAKLNFPVSIPLS